MICAPERLDTLLPDGLRELLLAHWDEVEIDRRCVPLAIDWDHYREMEAAGTYRIVSAREGGRLVGYSSFSLTRQTRYMNSLVAFGDVLFLERRARRGWNGVRLIRETVRAIKASGATRVTYGITTTARIGQHRATVGDLLARMGYPKTGEMFSWPL